MRGLRHLLCWIMAFSVPVSLSAAEGNPAILSGSGDVKVNGLPALQSSAVFVGDRVATGENSSVTISLKGTVITALPHSLFIYRDDDVELRCGTVVVNTQSAMKGHLGNLTISPNVATGKFELTRSNLESTEPKKVASKATVSSLQGAVDVTDGIHSVSLPAGQILTRETPHLCDDPAAGAPDTSTAGSLPKRGIPGWVWGVGAAGGVGAILAGVVAAQGSKSTPSPSQP
jgi:hypothetical protein